MTPAAADDTTAGDADRYLHVNGIAYRLDDPRTDQELLQALTDAASSGSLVEVVVAAQPLTSGGGALNGRLLVNPRAATAVGVLRVDLERDGHAWPG